MPDAVVVGAGPNGLVAALTLARAGLEVEVFERADRVGGGLRTAELTLPGFLHDVCSAVHPQVPTSPVLQAWGVDEHVDYVTPAVSFAHPRDGREAVLAHRSLDRTVEELGADGAGWRDLIGPLVDDPRGMLDVTGSALLRMPRHPVGAAGFAARVARVAAGASRLGPGAAALFTGAAAHAHGRHPSLATAGVGLLLSAHAHLGGWPVPVGGAQSLADALARAIEAAGGRITLNAEVRSPAQLPASRAVLLDTSPEFLDRFAGASLPNDYRRALRRFRRGVPVAKVDFALSDPVPWSDPRVALAPTVHLGGEATEIAAAERAVAQGRLPARPYVLVVQPTVVDATRAPAGKHVLWAYTHVPRGARFSELDATALITAAVERAAPGFGDTILAASARSPRDLAADNPNDVGGEMFGGALTVGQLVKRPVVSPKPWRTPVPGLYLCSAATPPGPSIHGMNGWYAARLALRDRFGVRRIPFS